MAGTTEKRKFDIPEQYQFQYKKDYESDWDTHRNYTANFDPWEAMLMGLVYDTVSNSVDHTRITDSYATTLAKERADRVMAKLPQGQTTAVGKADTGKALFMDILRQKWIYPNANSQHSFTEKLNMWQFYSSVYGYMPMFYDWNVSSTGYVGPDCWLWSPRNLVPQQGRASIRDMEYVTALTWVSKTYLEDILEEITGVEDGDRASHATDPSQPAPTEADNSGDGWDIDALRLLIQTAEQSSNADIDKDSKIVRERTPGSKKTGVCLATRYEAGPDGHWVTFAPDHGFIKVRDLENPHQNGRIPFVIKYSQPLFDSFYGLGDFQRAMPLQFARDGLTNFYFKGIKMNLVPPIVANSNGVVKHTLDYREGGIMLETIPNSIRRLETSTAGLATYQAAQTSLTGSLLSLYGSQNAAVSQSDSMNPAQGKTPQAIDLYADKEATRDGADRRHLEDAIEQLTDGFFSLIANIGTESIPVALFADDIKEISEAGLFDIEDLFTESNLKLNASKTAATLKINPKTLKGIEYRFNIDPDSTAQTNKQGIMSALKEFMGILGKIQNVLTEDPGVTVHWQDIMASYESLSGIPNASKFVTFDPQASAQAKAAAAQAAQQQQSQTQVSVGNQVHESADLVKLYLGSNDPDLKQQILQAMGFKPTAGEPVEPPAETKPTVISTGHAFHDPTIAAAAEALVKNQATPSQSPAPRKPAATGSQGFTDPAVANAASIVNNMK